MIVTLPALSDIPFILHGFTLRKMKNGQDFDLNLYSQNRLDHVKKNLKKLTELVGFPAIPLITCRQIHGNKTIKVDMQRTNLQKIREMQGDALITNQPNLIIGIYTADCLPILLIDKKQKAIGVIHAGRKGTMISIVKKVIDQMGTHFNTLPHDLIAGIGPGIKKCCYEMDILEANLQQLTEQGLLKKNIFFSDQCTSCRNDLFFSYRADKGKTGRMIGFIMLKT